ncbi:Putative 6-phosphogluconolactonase [Caenorhabditis elegans]|uniref:Putative 6-phosphogluconolactonase n=2 Tax=Caenorhabditis elegans TaxID=6239 RepID=6PGL_CAEEL|nr:Putative 6-phosphogluconolactonase [Caenorhabditis elegans]O18229.2 RecName: Full=Putative 6-phosphogluconolactonase; Short=6PGL [Caenorhabditis elegans]CAB16505.2 Putative 6-phosphogluconolactonase [Caenorhabditis elegans]|eukprot:NP_001041049.1 Putative 6-phosphogluconolactonase [Caenorhabditis elegans]
MCLVNEFVSNSNMKPALNVSGDEKELILQLRRYLEEKLTYLLDQNGTVSIGVSGGSMPRVFSKAILSLPQEQLNWKRIRIFMVDERNVDLDSEESNQGEYLRLFPNELRDVFVPMQIFKDPCLTAQHYEISLRKYLLPEQLNNTARFDILFLGVGPDGHTASIFPGKERLEKITELNWVSVITDSPKPPPSRITLTLQTLQHAKNVAFIICGKQKAEIVRGICDRDQKYPAAQARPFNDKLTLFLDEDAATGVPDRDSSDSDSPPPFDG